MENLLIILLFCVCSSLQARPNEWLGGWDNIYTPGSSNHKLTTLVRSIIGGTAATITLGTLWYFRDDILHRNEQLEDDEDEC